MALMTRADIMGRLKALEADLRAFGVSSLYLYGSHARGEARPDSDIDILADFAAEQPETFAQFMDAYHHLAEAFPGTEIGFSTRKGLVPVFRPHIERSAVPVFCRSPPSTLGETPRPRRSKTLPDAAHDS